jgi:hypothetical protein
MKNNAKKFPLPTGDFWFRLPERVSVVSNTVSDVADRVEVLESAEQPQTNAIPYKSYVAKIVTGQTPTVTVLENTLEVEVGVTTDVTKMVLTASNPIFNSNKTYVTSSNYNTGLYTNVIYPVVVSDTVIDLGSFRGDGGASLGYGYAIYVEVRVYE